MIQSRCIIPKLKSIQVTTEQSKIKSQNNNIKSLMGTCKSGQRDERELKKENLRD